MEALLSIRCYMCNGLLSGQKIFRIETRCSECKRIKSKIFYDTFNKLLQEMYQLILNKIYIDYTPSGIKFRFIKNCLKGYGTSDKRSDRLLTVQWK